MIIVPWHTTSSKRLRKIQEKFKKNSGKKKVWFRTFEKYLRPDLSLSACIT